MKDEITENNMYEEIEKSLENNIQDIIAEEEFANARKDFLSTIDIATVNQETLNPGPNIIDSVAEFKEEIDKASSGTILRVDKRVLEECIQQQETSGTKRFR